MPFEAKVDDNNRWVVLSKIVPWEEFARLYYKNFKSTLGAPVNRNEQCNIFFGNEECNVFGSNRATFSEAMVQ